MGSAGKANDDTGNGMRVRYCLDVAVVFVFQVLIKKLFLLNCRRFAKKTIFFDSLRIMPEVVSKVNQNHGNFLLVQLVVFQGTIRGLLSCGRG